MCVTVLLADDAELVRKAIHVLLSEREDITLVGEAATFYQAVQKAKELLPDVIVLDVHMADGAKESLPAGPKLLAISFANDDETKVLAASIGAESLLDKMKLTHELIPAILELAPTGATEPG
jgi:DNA-binding NarL/FixJ family response regulator